MSRVGCSLKPSGSAPGSASSIGFARNLLFAMMVMVIVMVCMIPVEVAAQGVDNENTGEKDFKTAGFPTITMIAGPMLLVFSIYSGLSIGGGQPTQYKLFCVLHVFLLFCGIIFTFGPGGSSIPVPILGVHLWFLVFLSVHVVLTNRIAAKGAYLALGLFTMAAFTGSLGILGYSAPIFTVNRTACLTYFSETEINRCEDKGFLQLIRTLGAACIFVIYLTLTLVYLDWASPAVTSSSSSSSSSSSTSSSGKTVTSTEPLLADHHHDHDHDAASHAHTTSYQSGEVH